MRYGYHPSEGRGYAQAQKETGFYKTPAWRRIRTQALTRDHFLCQLRISKKCSVIATEVHHIVPLETDPARGLDLENLVSCCWWCHEETKTRKKPVVVYRARVIRIADGSELTDEIDREDDSIG